MKITFIEPKYKFNGFNVGWINQLPMLGPLYLGTILKERGHEVEIYKEEIKEPKKLDCDILCLYALTSTAPRAYEIAKKFKEENPNKKVLIGGPHATALPHEALKYADHVVLNEAESVIVDLIEGRITDKIIPGGKYQELDTLQFPDFSLIKGLKRPINYFPIATSRGCPFMCEFCSVTTTFGHKYRFRSTQNVIEELSMNKYKRIFFYDDIFCAVRPRIKELLREMLNHGLEKPWMCQTRVEVAKDEELLKLMSDSKCDRIFIGLESVNPESLKLYQKGQTFNDIKGGIKKIRDYGIKIIGSFVIGSDADDKNTIKETIDFCDETGIEYPLFNVLTPLPGTVTYNKLMAEGRIFTNDWDLYDLGHIVFHPKKMTAEELQTSYESIYKNLYFKNAWKSLSKVHLFKDFINPLKPIQSIKTISWIKRRSNIGANYAKSLASISRPI